ncbi:MAG: glutamine--fructose-6-phosphate transaminase (isomerizing) [Deltaproteobacteria bacterium]|nr:glutamine--fructose-6-phosphate transaminase (isomerizing) [Deltaproteobacteria bacterium]
MCGIVGYVGKQSCAPILIDGLRRLEYRGYDSAGLAVHDGTSLKVVRAVGKLRNLESEISQRPLAGSLGIGHTRWATHGRPSEINAHPHVAGKIAVIHNGIIENYLKLRARLVASGARIVSDTDTEIIAHLIDQHARRGLALEDAVRAALKEVEGAYAIVVISETETDKMVVAKNASPLVIGLGDNENFCASDIPALLQHTNRVIILEDGDMAVVTASRVAITTLEGKAIDRHTKAISWSPVMAEKAGYKHFMLKEIFEQPRAIEDTLRGRLDREHGEISGEEIGLSKQEIQDIQRIYLVACGTSYYAAMTGQYYFERLARIRSNLELASEFRGRDPVIGEGDLVVAISQSGETLDTLMAAKAAKEKGAKVISISNVIGSAIPRISDASFYTHAGPEIGVASTKCFTAQLSALLMLSIYIASHNGALEAKRVKSLIEGLARVPQQMREVLQGTRQLVVNLAKRYVEAKDVLFLGRGLNLPVALEGALKLKEISYVHAEGYAAGEMKHGPIALIDANLPVIVLVPDDDCRERTKSNLQEAKARGAKIIAVATEGDEEIHGMSDEVVEIPRTDNEFIPFLTVLPLQLYAYYVADFKGTDVDQPRNLAKTVTVE